jgi:transcriptional regulator with XRE-family HTH domain
MTFGERLERKCEEKGWSQAELARRVQIPQGVISRMERGLVKESGITVLRKLALALGVTADCLIGMYEDEGALAVVSVHSP